VLVGTLTSPGRAQLVDSAYSPKEIFAPENSAVIYADCKDARDAAAFLAKHADAASADEAAGAQQFFLKCIKQLRGVYDTNATRYLLLALAAADYIEIRATTGQRHIDALDRGIEALGYVIPRPESSAIRNPQPLASVGPSAPNSQVSVGPPRRPPPTKFATSGARMNWQFAPLADSLRKAYEAVLSAEAPVPAPS
jgi:hypothetical protein